MWPYGYTYADVPADMTTTTTRARVASARHGGDERLPARTGSDLYITSGTTRDYLYGIYRVFAYTFEMSVKDYADDSVINAETGPQ